MTEKFMDKYRIPSARLRNWDYNTDGTYFITICTAEHECYFGEIADKKMVLSEIGSLVQMEWEKSFVIRAELFCDYFVIMPNHIHAILRIEHGICEQTNDELQDDKPANQHHYQTSEQIDPFPNFTTPTKFGVAYRSPKSISSFVAGFKSVVTVNAHKIYPDFAWQTRFYDHIIHADPEYQRIADYIENNPANWEQDKFYRN
jgi:putative transposase